MDTKRNYFLLVRRWLWLVLAATLLAGTTAYLVSRAELPTYEATTKLLVNAKTSASAISYNDVILSQQLTKTYSEMAVDPVVLQQVIRDGKLPYTTEQLAHMVSATPTAGTQLISITAHSSTAREAAAIANLVAQTFIVQQRARLANGAASDIISVVQPALEPSHSIGPKVRLNTALGMVAGMLLAIGIIGLLTYLDDTVKSQKDVEAALELPVLGLVPQRAAESVVTFDQGATAQHRPSAEAFHIIRTNLAFTMATNPATTVLVTSAQKGEGKTTAACKLAISLAESGQRVALVDADLRMPHVHRVLKIPNRAGLSTLLGAAQMALADCLQATPLPTLRVITAGPIPPNPADLLLSARMTTVLQALEGQVDIVVVDAPPVLAVADALILAAKVQGVLLVVSSGEVRVTRAQEALASLRRTGTPILGVVLNKVSKDVDSYYGDASYYAYVPEKTGRGHGNGRVAKGTAEVLSAVADSKGP